MVHKFNFFPHQLPWGIFLQKYPVLRWIKDLYISHDTIKVLEKNIGRKISDIPCSNILTDMSSKARDIKERINKWDLIKIKKLLHG